MFKKLFYIFMAVLTLFSLKVANSKPVFANFSNTFEVCVGQKSSGNFYKANNRSFCLFNGVTGESCIVNEKYSLEDVIEYFSAEKVFEEKVENLIITYYYSPKIKYVQKVNGKKINLQACVTNNQLKIGTPLIFGSF